MRQSTATGLTKKLVKAAVVEQYSFTDAQCSRGHVHRRREHFKAQMPSCTVSAQEQSKAWEQHNFCKDGRTQQYLFNKQTHRAHWRWASEEGLVEWNRSS